MMQTTRTRQRVARLTSSTATVCENLFMFGRAAEPDWSYIPANREERLTPVERARRLLNSLLSAQSANASAQDSRNQAKGCMGR